jgi:hypothetical protein
MKNKELRQKELDRSKINLTTSIIFGKGEGKKYSFLTKI